MKSNQKNITLLTILSAVPLAMIGILLRSLFLSTSKMLGFPIPSDSAFGNILLEIILFLVPFLIVKTCKHTNTLSNLGINFHDRRWLVKLSFGFLLGFVGINSIYLLAFSIHMISFECIGFQLYGSGTLLLYLIGLLLRALFAGVCEETLFRGFFQNYFSKLYNAPLGLLIASLIFGIIHVTRYTDPFQLISVFLTGLALGYLFMKTSSLFLSIGLHFATDFFIMVFAPHGQLSLFVFNMSSNYTEGQLTELIFAMLSIFYLLVLLFTYLLSKKKSTSLT